MSQLEANTPPSLVEEVLQNKKLPLKRVPLKKKYISDYFLPEKKEERGDLLTVDEATALQSADLSAADADES